MGIKGKFLGQTSSKMSTNLSTGAGRKAAGHGGSPKGKFLGQTKGKPAIAGSKKGA